MRRPHSPVPTRSLGPSAPARPATHAARRVPISIRSESPVLVRLQNTIEHHKLEIHNQHGVAFRNILTKEDFTQLQFYQQELVDFAPQKTSRILKNLKAKIQPSFHSQHLIFYKVNPIATHQLVKHKSLELTQYSSYFVGILNSNKLNFMRKIVARFSQMKQCDVVPPISEAIINRITLVLPKNLGPRLLEKAQRALADMQKAFTLLFFDGGEFMNYLFFLKWQLKAACFTLYLNDIFPIISIYQQANQRILYYQTFVVIRKFNKVDSIFGAQGDMVNQ
ncbi:hypothetical protein SS50377_23869 [Spironucleus salmonicida]|uniref:Uncharacterized protein n=1 Tax=Spironucleus salmonicida TaxID=348837 RepID=V6LKC5_9EUKA|nr:hypothetical protein SS50377_23869 [Spironucleus salmonicida]|eukprot:EST44166.1 Hypothetical protein SS50377_16074 [Spironucleus salmonicida]